MPDLPTVAPVLSPSSKRFIALPRCRTQISHDTHPTIAEPRPRAQYPPRQVTKLRADVVGRAGNSHARSVASFLSTSPGFRRDLLLDLISPSPAPQIRPATAATTLAAPACAFFQVPRPASCTQSHWSAAPPNIATGCLAVWHLQRAALLDLAPRTR